MWTGIQRYRVSRQRDQEPLMDTLQRTLAEFPLSFAIVFGSQVTDGPTTSSSDIDIAVEFDAYRPGDDGYNEMYFDLLRALEAAVAVDVDLIDVWTMSPQFAHVVFGDGERLIGTNDRQDHLEAELAGDHPTVEEARERVAAAATRLREDRS
jgi:predicted nucleotidyltransferase